MSAPVAAVGVSLRNILLPTDFSRSSETALTYGAGFARRFGATLYTVTVVPPEVTDYVQPPDPFYLRHAAERKMVNVASLEVLQGIRHREFIKEGTVSETLSDLIERLEIDLVVLGTHGRGGVKKFVLGSVTEGIVNSAPCPVLTVGPEVPPLMVPQPILRNILLATDLFHDSARALAYAVWLAEEDRARLTVLHVIKGGSNLHGGDPESEAETRKKLLAQLLPPQSIAAADAECIVAAGLPWEQILKVSQNKAAELIVMGPHHTPFARLSAHLPGTTPYEVICHAKCPVLTVHE
jgi:nucleotide-binding universal stress UspA family protein